MTSLPAVGAERAAWLLLALPAAGAVVLLPGDRRTDRWGHVLGVAMPVAIGVLYAAVVTIGQADLRRLIAYLSVSGMGLFTLDIFAMTSQGQAGAALQMVNHGFLVGALFLIAGFLSARRRSSLIVDYGGVQKTAPVLAGLFLVACLALPGLNTFVSEFLILIGTFTRYPVAAGFATTGIILSSIYMLWTYQRTMTGPPRPAVSGMPDLRTRELWAIGPMIALIIGLGIYLSRSWMSSTRSCTRPCSRCPPPTRYRRSRAD